VANAEICNWFIVYDIRIIEHFVQYDEVCSALR